MPTRSATTIPLALLFAGALAGCEQTTVPVEGVYHPTLIQVSPEEFLGAVPCRPSV